MESEQVVSELRARYSEATIVCIPEDKPQEIIAVLDIAADEPRAGIALAVIERSRPHYHLTITEVYTVETGTLLVHLDGMVIELRAGENLVIPPCRVHWAEATPPARVWVASRPPWSAEDHFLV